MQQAERRWRLVLGRLANRSLGGAPLDSQSARMQSALDYLYGRNYAKRGIQLGPDGRQGGLLSGAPSVLDWMRQLPALFPDDVCETLRRDALERYQLTEILQDPKVLEKLEPDERMLQSLLMLKGKMHKDVLAQLRHLIRQVVDDISRRMRSEIESAFSGRRNRFRRSSLKIAQNFDWRKTIRANLKNFDPKRRQLIVDQLYFNNRVKKNLPWEIILCIDQSGSMAASVIFSAVMAGILSGLPALRVRLFVFDTRVVDLSRYASDPVELLMTVQLGGGTDIGRAIAYCAAQIGNPQRTVLALISDFYEGANERLLLTSVRQLAQDRVKLIGLAALDNDGGPDYDRQLAEKLAGAGMRVGVMTPQRFARWLAEIMEH